jgi:hypothetical protein
MSKKINRRDDLSENGSQGSGDSKKLSTRRKRNSLLDNVQDSFKNMISKSGSSSPSGNRSPGARSPRTGSSEGSPKIPMSPLMKKIQGAFSKDETIPSFNFNDAVTIVGDVKNLKTFNELFLFLHGLDCTEKTNDENEVEGIYEIKTKYEVLKVQISNASTTQGLDFISNKYSKINHHSFIILWDKDLELYFNTWIDIMVTYSEGANIIVLYETDDDELMAKMENELSEKLVVNYVRFLPVDFQDTTTKFTIVEKALQYSLKNKLF